MSRIFQPLENIFKPVQKIQPGIYHYQAPQNDPRNYRLHLRIEEDGDGVMIVNAGTVLHLNTTAAEYAYYFVKNLPEDEVARRMAQRYSVSAGQARQDYRDFADRILTLVEIPDLDPVTFMDFERRTPYSGSIRAPYRLDCALTYRLPEGVEPEIAPGERVKQELTEEEWSEVLDKAWNVGIPHIVFTGGEPTLREDLPKLNAHAESNGQVSGLLTDGTKLADKAYLNELLMTGLDHLMILAQPDRQEFWTALQNIIPADIFTAVHLTLTAEAAPGASAFLTKLAQVGVSELSLSSSDPSLEGQLAELLEQASALHLSLVWDLPVPYSAANPVTLEIRDLPLPEGAGRAWLYIEPDGDVLPTQGAEEILGNLLNDPWETIWRPS